MIMWCTQRAHPYWCLSLGKSVALNGKKWSWSSLIVAHRGISVVNSTTATRPPRGYEIMPHLLPACWQAPVSRNSSFAVGLVSPLRCLSGLCYNHKSNYQEATKRKRIQTSSHLIQVVSQAFFQSLWHCYKPGNASRMCSSSHQLWFQPRG